MNQAKSDNHAHFSDISERLAMHLGINLDELPARISISKDMFYAYRTGRHRISEKAWRKLEAAEAAAGITPAVARPAIDAQGDSQIGLAQKLRAQAAQLLAMAEQVEREANIVLYTREAEAQRLRMEEYESRLYNERAQAKADLDEIERKVDAADDLPEVKPPVVRRRA